MFSCIKMAREWFYGKKLNRTTGKKAKKDPFKKFNARLLLEQLEIRWLPSTTWYVNSAATGNGTGTSWANAFTNLHAVLDGNSGPAHAGDQVWVAAGIYEANGTSFSLPANVAVYGGFTGTETALSNRDFVNNVTTLDGGGTATVVVDNNAGDTGTVLDGFIIQDGYGINGGGLYDAGSGTFEPSSPTISNVTFSSNSANYGGGVYAIDSNLIMSNVTFSNNSAVADGGGMYNWTSSPTLTNVSFSDDSANGGGGGMANFSSAPIVTNVIFSNESANVGGGMDNQYSSPTLTNVAFSNNYANYGGGMYNVASGLNNESSPTITNATFNGNYDGAIVDWAFSSPIVTNTILWGDGGAGNEIVNCDGTSVPVVSYTDVQGGYSGTHNINADPLFASPATGDLHLQFGSAAIAAGTTVGASIPTSDLDGNPRTGHNDIGAYQFEAQTWYVNLAVSGGADNGHDWADAFPTLQQALAVAHSGDQIWVAEGDYVTPGNPFSLPADVGVYGGFQGTEASLSQRDYVHNVTTLDGNENNTVVADDNQGDTGTVLDGFTIANGADFGKAAKKKEKKGEAIATGGGMYVGPYGAPTVENVIFNNNTSNVGGGMYNDGGSAPIVTNVIFSNNIAAIGGGMYDESDSTPTLTNVIFNDNSANSGGGIYNESGSLPALTGVIFSNDVATSNVDLGGKAFGPGEIAGGGIYDDNSSPILTNVIFSNNTADNVGGGMANEDSSFPTVTNATFTANSAPQGGSAIYNDGTSSATVTNTILWGDVSDELSDNGMTSTVNYSDVQGGFSGTANIDADPLFVNGDPTNPPLDLHLQSGSPAIGAGTPEGAPSTDLDGNPRPAGGPIDMGAYQFQNVAATSIAISAPTITYGANGVVTVTVSSAGGIPTGNVSLSVNGGTPIVQQLSGGSSTFTLTGLNAATYTLSASYAAQGNFAASGPTAGSLVVNPANATVVVTPYDDPYTGLAQTAIVSITGVNGETGATVGAVTLNTTHTNAGTYSGDSWSFTGTANYYSIASTQITDTITKANAAFTVNPYTVSYDANPHTATVTTITGVNGETGATVGVVTLNTTHTTAGTYSNDSWSFAGTANYNSIASTTITDTINKATLPVTVISDQMLAGNSRPALTGTVNGTPFTGSTTVTITHTGAPSDVLTVTLSCTATSSSAAGSTYPITATVTGTNSANYAIPTAGTLYVDSIGHVVDPNNLQHASTWTSTGSITITPVKAAATVTWLAAEISDMNTNISRGMLASDVVYAGGLLNFLSVVGANSGLDGGGFITIGHLLTLANAGYTAYQNAAAGTTGCLYMAALAQALQNANEDLSYVQQAVPPGI